VTRAGRTASAALCAALLLVPSSRAGAGDAPPARAPVTGCAWEKKTDAKLGLEAWVQRCDFGFRKIDFLFTAGGLAQRFSDGGEPDVVVEVLALEPGESVAAGLKRIFAAHAPPEVAARCVLEPYRAGKPPAGVERFTFVPDAAYAKELARTQSPDEVPEPPCGHHGASADGVAYFEAQPASGAAKVLYVRVGQDEPLFDAASLRLLPRREREQESRTPAGGGPRARLQVG